MPSYIDKIRIQNALIQRGQGGDYYAVSYSPSTKLATEVDTLSASKVTPQNVMAQELASAFGVDPKHGRDLVEQRTTWSWALVIEFSKEVTLHVAEETWLANPLTLARDEANGLTRQVTLHLVRVDYKHPTFQEAHKGTRATYFFEARLSRR